MAQNETSAMDLSAQKQQPSWSTPNTSNTSTNNFLSNSSVNSRKWVRFSDSTDPETIIDDPGTGNSTLTASISLDSIPSATTMHAANALPQKVARGHHQQHQRSNVRRTSNEDIAKIDVQLEEVSPSQQNRNSKVMAPTNNGSAVSSGPRRPATLPNGKIITTIFPANQMCPWFTVAYFDPYKMPKSLISDSLTMPVETYVEAMEKLTNDFRFRLYTAMYRRVIVLWFIACLFLLMAILVSGMRGIVLFSFVLFWLFATGFGILICLHVKRLINRYLHRCITSVNKHLLKYNLMIGIEDRGKLSCHKVALMFIYFDWKPCMQKITIMARNFDRNINPPVNFRGAGAVPSLSSNVEQPGDSVAYGRNWSEEEKATYLIAKCSQSYVKALARHAIRFPSRPSQGVADSSPLHCAHSLCLCQYVQHFYFEQTPRTLLQKIFLTDGIDWAATAYIDPGYHPGCMP